MFVLSTAGHVDHGKSTLIEALTGMSVDRLPEEKKRGMTIELNFAWLDTAVGKVGIIDVPGHKRYVKNMVVGSEQVDAFLFVVAADDGWMPQSEEHLKILEAFGIAHGIVVLTKTDLVDRKRVEEVKKEISRHFQDTFQKDFQIFEFRKDTKEAGLPIQSAIEKLLKSLTRKTDHLPSRLWVDRSFSPRGLGLVISGTLREGKIALGDKLVSWPSEESLTVRNIESYKEKKEVAVPVSRVALQLSKGSVQSIARGSLLSSSPVETVSGIKVQLKYFQKPLTKNTHLKFYLGTLETECHLIPLKKEAENIARIRFKKKVPVRVGEKFLLRLFGEERTVGGGVVLEFFSKKKVKAPSEKKKAKPLELSSVHQTLLQKALVPVDRKELEALFPKEPIKKRVQELVLSGYLKPLKFPFFVTVETYAEKVAIVTKFLKEKGQASTAELKEVLSMSRKPAVLFLEKMDDEKITRLEGGVRVLVDHD